METKLPFSEELSGPITAVRNELGQIEVDEGNGVRYTIVSRGLAGPLGDGTIGYAGFVGSERYIIGPPRTVDKPFDIPAESLGAGELVHLVDDQTPRQRRRDQRTINIYRNAELTDSFVDRRSRARRFIDRVDDILAKVIDG